MASTFAGIPSLRGSMVPPPLTLQSSMNVAFILSILYWFCEKPSSSLVSDINKMPTLILTISIKNSNLLLKSLIFEIFQSVFRVKYQVHY